MSPEEGTFRFIKLCERQDYAAAQKLLERCPEIANHRVATSIEQTTLHLAAARFHRRPIEMLLNAGADVNLQDKRKLTPLDYILYWGGQEDTYLLLVEKGAKSSARPDIDPVEALTELKAGKLKLPPLDEPSLKGTAKWLQESGIEVKGLPKKTPNQGIQPTNEPRGRGSFCG